MTTPRFVTEGHGYTTWHCFSSGAHYDPARISWGPVIAIDEHLVAPGGGFDWHPHRGVHIASWVLDGILRHEDSAGGSVDVVPGKLLVQSTGEGIRHRETNASSSVPLRMVQLVVLGSAPYSLRLDDPPAELGEMTVDIVQGPARTAVATFDTDSGVFAPDGTDVGGTALVLHRTPASEIRQ